MNQDEDYPGKRQAEAMARLRVERDRANQRAQERYDELTQQARTSSPGDDLEAIAKARGAANDRQVATFEEAQRSSRMAAARAKFAELNAKLSPEQRLSNLMGALADDVEEMTDEQLLAEAKDAGVDITGLAARLRGFVTEGGKRSLLSGEIAAAKAKGERAERRERLIAAIRLLTVDDDEPETLPPLDRAEWPDYYQELREAAEAYFGDDFRTAKP